MADFQAFLVITLLTWAAVSVSGTTKELSTTTGDTVSISCDFGEGTLRNIFWYHNNGTRSQKILSLFRGKLDIEAEYTDRASLQSDNLTLILNDTTVSDQGTYQCDVDRQGQTAVPNINTKLNVFSLRPDTLPMIPLCTGADESSSCSIHANQSFTLTCTLPNVYPVEDTELIWYQDGKHFSSTHDDTQNDDGTTNISRQIQISETGNFTCNATYHSANGRENTAVSVEAWIILSTVIPNTQGKNLTSGEIIGITIGTALLVGISLAIITVRIYHRSKQRRQRSSRTDKKKKEETKLKLEASNIPGTSAENGSKDEKESVQLIETPADEEEKEASNLPGTSAENCSKDEKGISAQAKSNEETSSLLHNSVIVSEKELLKLSKLIEPCYYNDVGINLDISTAKLSQIKERSQNISDALMTVFTTWRDKQPPGTDIRALLAEGLERSELGSLSGELLAGSLIPKKTAGEGDRPTPQNSGAKSQQCQAPASAASTSASNSPQKELITQPYHHRLP